MILTNEKLKDLLVNPGHISEADFENGKNEAQKRKIDLEKFLVEKGLISDENLGQTIANGFDYHFIDLKKVKISDDLLAFIPEVVARSQQAVVFERGTRKQESNTTRNPHTNNSEIIGVGVKQENNGTMEQGDNEIGQDVLKIATSNPENYEFFKLLERKTGCRLEIYYATSLGIKEALVYYKSDLNVQAQSLIDDLKTNPQNEKNIVKLVNLFLEYAHDNRASDIHIEPSEEVVVVRFRIDGILHEAVRYEKLLHDQLVRRLKIMAHLPIDIHDMAQDGRFDFKVGGARFDVRLSIMPITNGENVVMRLLSEISRRLALEDLGLLGDDLEKVKRAAEKPYGMILSAGPTGSGKTTTLYAILRILNNPEVNIMTIEDPVEYEVEHIQQTQVNAKKKLTFANGLRSIVRQDPDIIMVGEIRDNETAGIAVNAAMTGHLLLSTLHSNDAATSFPRLIDMGVEPFLVSSSVNVIVAQRLVRKICEKCRVSYEVKINKIPQEVETRLIASLQQKNQIKPTDEENIIGQLPEEIKKKFFDKDKIILYRGTGCKICGGTGYSGRTGVFEVMEITEELRSLIAQKASAGVIAKKAIEGGMRPMIDDGINKVLQGITTFQEVISNIKS